MSKIMPAINDIIKNKRKQLKITQEEFTKIINKSIATVRRYDTGDFIPDNTIILICDKLNIDIDFLIKEQNKQNELLKSFFYDDLINKFRNNKLEKKTTLSKQIKITSTTLGLNIIYTAFNQLLDVLDVPTVIETIFKNDRYYVIETLIKKEDVKAFKELKNINKQNIEKVLDIEKLLNYEKILDILTQEQADKLINDMQEYFEFKTEKLRKEKLNK